MKKFLKILKVAGGLLAILAAAGVATLDWASGTADAAMAKRYAAPAFSISDAVRVAPLALGERIVRVRNGCVDCHGDDLAGRTFIDNGFAGSIRAPNLTPAALRSWTDEEIAAAIRYGIGRDGRPLVVMPSYEYQHLGRDDVAAIVAYLRSVPPVERSHRAPEVGPGARLLYAIGRLPTLLAAEMIDRTKGFADKPAEAPTADFGRYLASSACAGCHGESFRGGPIPGGPPEWAPAASLRLGADPRWTREGFIATVRTGRSALDGHELRAPMPNAVLSKMSDLELGALWEYLGSLD